jgi:hypothetical protein
MPENYTRNEWKRCKTTLKTSGEDVKTTLETGGELTEFAHPSLAQ